MADYLERKRKYEPLAEHLAAVPRTRSAATLSFADVERVIGGALPPSAREYRQWWENQDRGSHAPLWLAAGFKVDKVDFSRERVTFVRLAPAPDKRSHAMTLQEVVTAVNERALGRPIGGLPEWRRTHKHLSRLPSKTLFYETTTRENYVFHVGGRSELQYNIGFEPVGEDRMFRHGIAFSLEPSQTLPDVTVLVPKIERFNKYVRVYPDAFDGFQMWNWLKDDRRSKTHAVRPIPDKLAQVNYFIFIGRLQPADAINVDLILDDLDRLLPVYEFVEGSDRFPARAHEAERKGFGSPASNKPRAAQTSYERSARTVEVTLRHNEIADTLAVYLEGLYGEGSTKKELPTGDDTRIDVAVDESNGWAYYEIKVHSSAQECIREALGQLLEYSHWPGANRAHRLVVVGEALMDKRAKVYMEFLRKEFSLPVEYRQFDMKSRRLI